MDRFFEGLVTILTVITSIICIALHSITIRVSDLKNKVEQLECNSQIHQNIGGIE